MKYIIIFLFLIGAIYCYNKTTDTVTYICGKVQLMQIASNKYGEPYFYISAAKRMKSVDASVYVQYKVGDNFCWESKGKIPDGWFLCFMVFTILSFICVVIILGTS